MGRLRTWTVTVGAICLLALTALPGSARAEDDAALDLRLFHVGALTDGFHDFGGERPPPASVQEVAWNGASVLFGWTSEESTYPVGQVDELIEIVKTSVEPGTWESVEGADMRSVGEGWLFVRAPGATLDAVGRYLADLEAEVLRTVRVELRAVPAEATRTSTAEEAAAHPQAWALSLLAVDRQRASAYGGTQMAYVGGYHTLIAQSASISTPRIEVANLGLIANARVTLGPSDARATLEAQVDLSRLHDLDTREAGEGRPLESLHVGRTAVASLLEIPLGAWRRIGTGGDWTVLARVSAHAYRGSPRSHPSLRGPARGDGAMTLRRFDVGDFDAAWADRYAGCAHVTPSGYAPPEPPELGSPGSPWSPDTLVQFLMETAGEAAWQDPASIEVRGGRLLARNTPAVLDGLERSLGLLRRQVRHGFELEIEVLDATSPALRGALAGDEDSFGVSDAGLAALEAARAAEEVGTVDRTVLRIPAPASGAARSGAARRYLGEYTGNVAQEAASAKPVTFELFTGLLVTARARLLSTGDAAHVQLLECQCTEHGEAMRRLNTPCGPVDLPAMDVHRVRGGFIAPLGRPVLVSASGTADVGQVILATLRRVPAR